MVRTTDNIELFKPYGGRIEEWNLLGVGVVTGFLFDDPNQRWEDGTFMHTSSVVRIKEDVLETRNTTYTLGQKAETL